MGSKKKQKRNKTDSGKNQPFNPEKLPAVFLERLDEMLPEDLKESVVSSFAVSKEIALRINTLKIDEDKAKRYLERQGISFDVMEWDSCVLVTPGKDKLFWRDHEWVKEGRLYIQELSSTLAVAALDPKPGDSVLDMCAAPGSKTSHIAARLNNEGRLVALDVVKDRYFHLKANCDRLGVKAEIKRSDARHFKSTDFFDKILLDAPCSSEARFRKGDKESFRYWSVRKIKETSHKQKGLLQAALRLLKPGGTLVYSTCTFAPEENESCCRWILRKHPDKLSLQTLPFEGPRFRAGLNSWHDREFPPEVSRSVRVWPDNRFGAFFIAKFMLE